MLIQRRQRNHNARKQGIESTVCENVFRHRNLHLRSKSQIKFSPTFFFAVIFPVLCHLFAFDRWQMEAMHHIQNFHAENLYWINPKRRCCNRSLLGGNCIASNAHCTMHISNIAFAGIPKIVLRMLGNISNLKTLCKVKICTAALPWRRLRTRNSNSEK